MRNRFSACCVSVVLLVAPAFSAGAVEALKLTTSRAIAPDTEALPRIADATTPPALRINAGLDRFDRHWLASVRSCEATAKGDHAGGGLDRRVETTMRGPAYLSIVTRSEAVCSQGRSNYETEALVYDLNTGSPVNWSRLLPGGLIKSTDTFSGHGGMVGVFTSPRLEKIYLQMLAKEKGDEDCAPEGNDHLRFLAWPEAKQGGLALQAVTSSQACNDTEVIPGARLRQLGAEAGFVDAIDRAHRSTAR